MFKTKSKKEEPVIISPSFQLPIILIVLSFMLLFLSVALWSGQIWSTIFYKVPPIVFWTSVRSGNVSLTSADLTSMLIKSVVFGLLISIIACGYGLTTKGGPKEVGTSTTGAVVMTLVTVSLMDVLLTQILFG